MSHVMIVGNRSMVGRAVGQSLVRRGHTVTWAGRFGADLPIDLEMPFPASINVTGINAVVMVAADFGGTEPEDLARAARVNALGALNVCRIAQSIKAQHVMLVSSISAAYRPEDPYFGAYSLTKRHGEELAQLFCNQVQLPLAILRPSQLYDSVGEGRRHQGLLYRVVDLAEAGRPIEFFGTHDARRNYLHVDDFVEIVVRVIATGLQGVYECPYPEFVRLSELGRIAQEIFGRGGEIRFLRDRPDQLDLPDVSGDQIYNAIGYVPNIDIANGIQKIKHYREHGSS